MCSSLYNRVLYVNKHLRLMLINKCETSNLFAGLNKYLINWALASASQVAIVRNALL